VGSHHAHGRACGSNRIQVDNWGGSDKKGDRLEVWVGDRLEVLVVDVDIGGILEVGSGGRGSEMLDSQLVLIMLILENVVQTESNLIIGVEVCVRNKKAGWRCGWGTWILERLLRLEER
jgi:hypothetical protein